MNCILYFTLTSIERLVRIHEHFHQRKVQYNLLSRSSTARALHTCFSLGRGSRTARVKPYVLYTDPPVPATRCFLELGLCGSSSVVDDGDNEVDDDEAAAAALNRLLLCNLDDKGTLRSTLVDTPPCVDETRLPAIRPY